MTTEEFDQKYTDKLNGQQKEAVRAIDGAVLLLAVPGSGKTTVLVTRLGFMVCCAGIQPDRILTMTYTRAATDEMRQRFGAMFGRQYADAMEFSTINSVSLKIINYYSQYVAKRPAFTLVDERDAYKIIRQIYQDVAQEYPTDSTIKDISSGITYIKNMMLKDDEIEACDFGVADMLKIFQKYRSELERQRLMDFDDQMVYAQAILKKHSIVLEHFQDKYHYICVDESQDTSKIQHAIIKLLAQKRGNIFIVGDEDQSIFGFRAAYPDALMNFESDYPGAKILLMENNYRSKNEIIAAANAFVSRNRFRYEKSMRAVRGNGTPVRLIRAENREAQYKYLLAVARNCKEETAVLYRNNDSALPLIDMLERGGIPYNCKRFDEVFFSNRIVNDITDIIHFAHDQFNAEIFMRIYYKFDIQLTRKCAEFACEQSRISGKPILEELLHCPDLARYAKDAVIDLIEAFPEILKDDAVTALNRIWRGMRYGNFVRNRNLDEGKLTILKILGQNEPSPRRLLDRLGELQSIIRNHNNMPENRLLLSTVHSSKGLEYDRVYLLDIIDGLLPQKCPPDLETDDDIKLYEEDRRVYYVAMTRAKNELHLFGCAGVDSCFTSEVLSSMPQEEIDDDDVFAAFKRNMCGKTYTDKALGKGRIIAQCGETVLVDYDRYSSQLLSVAHMFENRDTTVRYVAPNAKAKVKPSSLTTPKARFSVPNIKKGNRIEHKSFGPGTVTSINDDIAEVYFHRSKQTKRIKLSLCISAGLLNL